MRDVETLCSAPNLCSMPTERKDKGRGDMSQHPRHKFHACTDTVRYVTRMLCYVTHPRSPAHSSCPAPAARPPPRPPPALSCHRDPWSHTEPPPNSLPINCSPPGTCLPAPQLPPSQHQPRPGTVGGGTPPPSTQDPRVPGREGSPDATGGDKPHCRARGCNPG